MDRQIAKKTWTPKRFAYLFLGGLVGILILYSLVLGTRASSLKVARERITVSTVERGPFQEFIAVSGTVIPRKSYFLDAVEGGRVDTVYLEAGSFVKQGDPILKLVNTNLRLETMYREAELFQQSNNLRNTKLEMARNSLEMRRQLLELRWLIRKQGRINEGNDTLAGQDLISAREYEEAADELRYLEERLELTREVHRQDSLYRQNQIEQLEASLVWMQENLNIIRQNLENLVVKAPVSGHLTSLNADVGESMARGTRLGQIDILDGFQVRVPVDEHYIRRVQIGQSGSYTLSGRAFQLTIAKIYPEVLEGSFEIDMVFAGEEPGDIRRGQSLRIRLALGDLSEAVLLRTGGFYQTTGGHWAYVVDKTGRTAQRRPIQLGRQSPSSYEVLSGLEPGDRVVTSSYEGFGKADQLILKQ